MTEEQKNTPAGEPMPVGPGSLDAIVPLETENLIDTYQVIAEWIRFADAKAAVVLTVCGALAGLLIPTLKDYLQNQGAAHPTEWWTRMVVGLYLAWLGFMLLSSIWAFRCILPYRQRGRHPALDRCTHFHPAAIGAAYRLEEVDRFIDDCARLGTAGLKDEVTAGLLFDSHISGAKYRHVTTSIQLMGISALIAMLYLLAIQF